MGLKGSEAGADHVGGFRRSKTYQGEALDGHAHEVRQEQLSGREGVADALPMTRQLWRSSEETGLPQWQRQEV